MRNNYSNYLGVVTSAGASDEHPLSIHSASIRRRWHSRGMQLICTLVLLFTFAIGQMWATVGSFYVTSFEETSTLWTKNAGTAGVNTVEHRTGSKGAFHIPGTANSSKRCDLKDFPIVYTKNQGEYLHLIFYAKTRATIAELKYSIYLGSAQGEVTKTSGLPNSTSWTQYYTHGSKTTSYEKASAYFSIKLSSASDTVYYDDIIAYVSSSETTDITAPSQATSASATSSTILWSNGSDTGTGATGIQKTLIWKRTSGSSNDLLLNPQGIYSLTSTEGPSTDQSGHWTLISATVAADATSYSGSFDEGDVYAIVHRDLAYNYSTPAYVTIPGGGGGGGDPVDPVFTYTPATYTIGDPALDLSTKLSSTNTTGAITFAISTADAGTTGASIASSKNFTATTAGTAKVTVSQAASTGYNAKSQDIEVTVVAPDPCTSYFWFAKSADATTAGKTNWDGFTITQSGSSNNTSGSKITIDGTDYAVSGRTSSNVTANIATFTVPANKAGKFYALLQSSGSTTRTIYLKQGDNTLQTLTDAVAAGNGNDAALSEVVIDNIPAGTYSVIANNNTRIGMLALKVCDATYHTITLDLNGGTGATSIAALDGVPAFKPADPTKAKADFVKWVVKSTEADYAWTTNVTGDLTLKAVWAEWPTLTLAAGEGATGTPVATQYKAGTEITVPEKPEGFSKGTDVFTGWAYSQTVTVTDGKFDMPATNLTLTAQWQAPSNFDVKFFQGFGDVDVQIGETQNIATGEYATAPTNPTRSGYRFLGWSYDATAAHIVNVAEYAILATTDFTAMWQKVWTVSFDGANETTVDDGSKIASPDSPSQAGKVFQGWYNGESKYDFSANVTADLALTSKWADANANHFYYNYKDDFHYDGVVYKTPEGKTTDPDAAEASNVDLTTPYTLFSGAAGITSIIATKGIYDYKKGSTTKHVTAYLKINTSADSYLTFTIKAGYTAVLKMKMGGYSANPTVTLKKGDDVIEATSGTPDGKYASKENDFNEITYDLAAGTYTMTTATKTLYISHIDLEATALPTYAVTYAANGGSGTMTDSNSPYYAGAEVTLLENAFTPAGGFVWSGWAVTGNVSGDPIAVSEGKFTMPAEAVTVTAQWTDVSKVVKIVETDAKYDNFADAIAAVEAGQTIQLIQNCEYSTYWDLDGSALTGTKTVTLDLNGKNLTYTGSLRGVQVSNGGTLVLMDGTATVAPTIDLTTSPMARTAISYTSGTFDSNDGMCALAGSEIVINSGRYLATEGVILVKGPAATATVNDGVLICRDNSVVGGNGTNSADFRNYVMNIHGGILYGEIFSAGYASMVVYHPNVGTLNIDGGILVSTNGPCVVTRGGETNITGGTLVALGSGSGKCGDASLVLPAVGVACDFKSAYPGVASTNVAISGTVDVTGEAGAVKAVYKAAEPTAAEVDAIGVSGGTFNTELTNEVCAPGFVPQTTPNAQGKYSVEPKDGVCLIGTKVTGDTSHGTVYGYYAGTADVKVSSKSGDYTYKFNKGNYIGVTLVDGQNFQAGDVVKIRVSAPQNATGFTLYTTKGTDSVLIMDTRTSSVIENGIHSLVLPNTYAGSQSLYLLRQNNDYTGNMNLCADSIAVYRVIYPTLTAITINGVECKKGTGNAFSVTLPEATTDLTNLNVVPTIVRNAAHTTTPEAVVSNEGAWVAGDNTYRVMDKDGDYTDYTITITLQGNAETPSITDQPQTQSYCAGSEPTLSVTASVTEGTLHYAWFKEAGETDEAVGEDQATYTVAGAGTYYVIVTNKVTGKLDASITSDNAVITLNTAAAITAQPTAHNDVVSGTEITLSVTATNATGYQWYICDDADKTNASAISGAEAASYVFTCTASAYYYCVVGNACGDDLTSNVVAVKLEPEGCNTFASKPAAEPYNYEQTGEWTFYNVDSNGADKSTETVFTDGKNFDDEDVVVANTRRFALKFEKDVESVTLYGVGGDKSFTSVSVSDEMAKNTYTELTTSATRTDVTDKNHIFTVDDVIIPANKYAWFEFSGSLHFFKICYTEAIEKPVIATQPATKIDFAAGDMTATVVVNAVTEGTLKYQWYNADGDVAVEGATSATLTTTEGGTYYVIVSNTLAGHKDYAVKSDEATLAYRQANDATLSALSVSAGALDPTFDKAVEEYRVDLPKGTTTVPTLTATATMAAYGATAVVTNAAEFENYEAVSTVLVTAEDHTTQKTYTVHYYVAHAVTTLADVTENTTWDWSLVTKKADGTTISGDGPKLNENEDGLILASYLSGDDFDKLEGNHNAYAIRNGSDKKVYQGASLHMHTTKGGYLSIWAANEGNSMTLNVLNAGRDMEIATLTGSQVEYTVYVQAGDVRIYNVSSESKPMRVSKIVFTVDETPDYTRDQMLGAGVYGTICLPYNVPAGGAFGATFYEMAGRNPENGKIVMDEVTALEAGVPYVFEAHGDIINVFYGETHVDDPVDKGNGMYGTFVDQELTELDDVYYFAQRALWGCADLTSLNLPANRAYVKLSEVDYLEPNSAPAPGRRRITFSVNGEQTATGIDALNAEDAPVKMMIDGKLFILRGEKLFDATGRLVK